ncbi:hypothetical protein BDZ88DRAFT_138656 [Geranomyces variabilis]|nr:hypothetical protein BDZ88DRAFT_138656 [Geranomyces variabilis]KAJ3143546.1 hypothetical protein HDU90_000309 [Geranomyces variabilis]
MLSEPTNHTSAADGPRKLNRKARRSQNRLKAEISDAFVNESPLGDQTVLSATAAAAAEPDTPQNESKGVYAEVINKKLRALRKKLTKLEKYEHLPTAELNADQIQALDKKPEIVAAAKELEEAVKLIVVAEAEEAKSLAAGQRAAEEKTKQRIAAAVEECKSEQAAKTRETLKLFYVLNVLLPKLDTTTTPIREEQYNALCYARAQLTGLGMEANENSMDFLESAEEYLQKYLVGSKEPIAEHFSFSFADLADAANLVLNPPPAPKFGMASGDEAPAESASFFSAGPAHEEERTVEALESVFRSAGPAFGSLNSISFFSPSEVLVSTADFITEDDEVTTELIVETVSITPADVATTSDVPAAADAPTEEEKTDAAAVPEASAAVDDAANQAQAQQPRQQNGNRGRGGYRGRGRGGDRGGRGGAGHQGGHRGRGRGGSGQGSKNGGASSGSQ